jgi:CRP-like cAMP-binding protein
MARKDSHLDRLAEVPMFRALSAKQLQLLAKQAETVGVGIGTELVREGDPGTEFFVVVSGEVSVTSGGTEVAVLKEGDFFGELALLDPAPRDATVTALSPVEVLVIDARRFRPLLEDVPQLAQQIMVGLARRLREADARRVWQS